MTPFLRSAQAHFALQNVSEHGGCVYVYMCGLSGPAACCHYKSYKGFGYILAQVNERVLVC